LPYPKSDTENPHLYFTMGTTAENVAKRYSIDRKSQQEFAILSHQKAHEAQFRESLRTKLQK
jgi:acetyl-CoA acyltransferase